MYRVVHAALSLVSCANPRLSLLLGPTSHLLLRNKAVNGVPQVLEDEVLLDEASDGLAELIIGHVLADVREEGVDARELLRRGVH